MIDPKELRIGNLVRKNEFRHEISWIDFHCLHSEPQSPQYNPILITPEWLERLGFELHKPCGDEGFIKWKHKNGVYLLWIEGKFWHDHWSTGIWINSVHQLQNLYFALTGTELKIKQP